MFDAPIDMIWEAREKRFENPDQFPELQKHEEIERVEEGHIIRSKRKLELASNVPGALRKVLSDDMLQCIDDSEYNMEEGTHKWNVKPTFKTDVFKCTGFSRYTEIKEDDEVQTRREIMLEVKVKIPFVGKLAEQFILDAYKKNLDKDNKTIKKMIEIMKEEKE